MAVSRDQIEHVALLARLEIDEQDLDSYTQQLSDILTYMEKLNELDTEEVNPTAHVLPMKNVLREDEVKEGIDRESVLRNAPDQEEGQFKVPKIV